MNTISDYDSTDWLLDGWMNGWMGLLVYTLYFAVNKKKAEQQKQTYS